MKKTTVYCLRIRESDDGDWGDPTFYRTRKERDSSAHLNRCLGGIRTWSYEEKKSAEEMTKMVENDELEII